jgi:hypothetical protein
MRGSRRNAGRDEGFVPPVNDDTESVFTRDQYPYDRRPNEDEEEEDEREHHRSPFADQPPQLPPPSFVADPQPRASMDAYGAFNDPVPSGYGGSAPISPVGAQSRPVSHISPTTTTPDPYAQIRANLGGATVATGGFGVAPPPPPVPLSAPPPPPTTYPAPPNYTASPPLTYGDPNYTGTGAVAYGQPGGFAVPPQPPAQQGQYQYPTYQ